MKYDYKAIEKKWQDIWDAENTFAAKQDFSLPKYYALVEFPYPSGQGLHVGHPRSYTALDIVARKKRLCGYNVLYPMGWDAFGLPTENYAMKNHIHPEVVTANNVARFKSQLKSLGLSFDWTREINTTDPSYYKWTQWIFLQLYKKGLAYKKEMSVNWCTSCKVVLANEEVVGGVCERCGGPAKRETDTMPQWAGSSWYFLRYMDPHNNDALASREALEYWSPVDWYNGGMEHTTLHLLYSRFWHKFLYDIGVVPTREPYQKRTSHGMILGENGEKMSKSRGNVVNPDDIVRDYGADTMRLYEMFIGDFEKSAPWNTASIKGCRRFLERVWSLADILVDGDGYSAELEGAMHRTIKKVTEDIEVLKMNTAIAAMMSLLNEIYDKKSITRGEFKTLLILLNPFAPHITEELWQQCGYEGQLAHAKWPEFDEAKCVEDTVEIAVQVNGKLRAKLTVATGAAKEDAIAAAKAEPNVAKALEGKTICKEIYVPGKLVNIAVR